MSESDTPPDVFVDYVLHSPFGPLQGIGGPFSTEKDARGFIEELKQHHGRVLAKAEPRRGPAPPPIDPRRVKML